jgi:hypothetical protein
MLSRIRSACFNSLTIAWSYFLAVAGALLHVIDYLADPLGDPAIRDQIAAAIGDTRMTGRILLGISLITIIARLRSLRRAA